MQKHLSDLENGSWFYCENNGMYELYQLLDRKSDQILVKAFWPDVEIPQLDASLLRSACTNYPHDISVTVHFLEIGELTPPDYFEIERFKEIVTAKKLRSTQFETFLQEAEKAFESRNFEDSVKLLNEAAPYSKLDTRIYSLRGKCYFELGQKLLAKSDFQYVLDFEDDKEIEELLEKL